MSHQVGDIVELLSGSPKLTVSSVEQHEIVVKWYDTITGSIKSTHGPHGAFRKTATATPKPAAAQASA